MKNTLYAKPDYTIHREVTAVDPVGLSTFLSGALRVPIDCAGYNTVTGFVVLEGGSSPTVSLTPYEVATYRESDGTKQEALISAGSAIGPLNSGGKFEVTIEGGRLLMRVSTITGGPTAVLVYLAGASRQDDPAMGRRA